MAKIGNKSTKEIYQQTELRMLVTDCSHTELQYLQYLKHYAHMLK